MASHSQLKYGARLINSYLGNNATISCCEVLNSLIFPTHEQHHNNSFLCAAVVMGQSNIPAGATIGSNHNSRGADGEFIAGRGFWPGLCVSIKHNTKLASFTILAKGDYAYELNIPLPFALVSIDAANDRLLIMPAYWFLYNMYALARNSWKYADRDKRIEKIQLLENDYLAPDSVNEMFAALPLLEIATGAAFYKHTSPDVLVTDEDCRTKGKQLLREKNDVVSQLEITVPGFENAKRKTVIIKVQAAYDAYISMITYYGLEHLMLLLEECAANKTTIKICMQHFERSTWLNVGGQLIPQAEVERLKREIKEDKINDWNEVHFFYEEQGKRYPQLKREHALASLASIKEVNLEAVINTEILSWLDEAIQIKQSLVDAIYSSRAKDYSNPFRKMTYESEREMQQVLGAIEDNSFIKQQQEELDLFINRVTTIKASL